MKTLAETTSTPRPASVISARRIVTKKKKKFTFTVLKDNSVPIRNNVNYLQAVENRQAFIKNKKGIICTNGAYYSLQYVTIRTKKKSTFTVLKDNSVPIRNNVNYLQAVENRQAFIKNKKGIICTNDNYYK